MTLDSRTTNNGSLSPRTALTLWVALVAALSVGGSLAFACAAPLAAIAALAGSKMERGAALALVVAAWLSNQIVGYGILDYPLTYNSFAWGAAIGIAALLACLGAQMSTAYTGRRALGLATAFIVAFAAYELALYVVGIPLSASGEAFSAPVVARIFEINLVSFVGLLALYWTWSQFARGPVLTNQTASAT